MAELQSEPLWPHMVNLVARQRADFLLAPFPSNASLQLVVGDQTLVPLQDVRVTLLQPRCLAVSGRTPMVNGPKALQRGLSSYGGWIECAYEQSGFYNPAVKNGQ